MFVNEKIVEVFKQIQDSLMKTNAIDLEHSGDKFDFDRLIEMLEWDEPLLDSAVTMSKIRKDYVYSERYDNLGEVSIFIQNNNIYATIYSAVKALWCGNNVNIIMNGGKNLGLITVMCKIISECMNNSHQTNILNLIFDYGNIVIPQTAKKNIVIGDKNFFVEWSKTLKNVYYVPLAKSNVIITDKELFDSCKKDVLNDANIITMFNDNDQKEFTKIIDDVNENMEQYKTILITKDADKIEYFLKNIKSSIVAVNCLNVGLDMPVIPQEVFLDYKIFLL